MTEPDRRSQARAWARVARAAAHAHDLEYRGAQASGELFDAIEFAATDARLDLRDLVDAYAAGARELDLSEAFDAVEDYLQRIAGVQELQLSTAFTRAERALPDWRRQARLAHQRQITAPAWATPEEIADDRGAPSISSSR